MLRANFLYKLLAQTVFLALCKTIYPAGARSAAHLRQKAALAVFEYSGACFLPHLHH